VKREGGWQKESDGSLGPPGGPTEGGVIPLAESKNQEKGKQKAISASWKRHTEKRPRAKGSAKAVRVKKDATTGRPSRGKDDGKAASTQQLLTQQRGAEHEQG